MPTINGIKTLKVDVTGSGETWNLKKNGAIIAADYGFNVAPTANNNKFNIDGDILAQIGVLGQGARMTVNVGKSGNIDGQQYGIIMVGADRLDVDVDGHIASGQYGIQSAAARTNVDVGKSGSIEGVFGIFSTGVTSFSADIDGEVSGLQYGVLSAAAQAKVVVGGQGTVSGGQYGIFLAGAGDGNVVNHGSVASAAGYGVFVISPGGEVRNTGDIRGIIGVAAVGDGGLVFNGEGATIAGISNGITAATSAGNHFKIVNHGTVIASDAGFSIVAGDGDEKITSDGRLIGNVQLGGGSDVVDVLRGSVKGDIYGGDGDDTLITDKASHKLTENAGEGTDTVKSMVDYTLSAEVEKLILIGNKNIDGTGTATANVLQGNSGDNKLTGLAGADIFFFSSGGGDDKVMDLATGVDDVNLSGWNAINNFAQLLSHAHNENGHVVITAGSESLAIMNMLKADLDTNDFVF
ncbi:MAG: hemolysin-type calcium-binding repeat family protein [Rhizobium sp.]|nr:hemolysin-type calcium-binding repeat family protein [Rhizobium sp.]